MQIHMRGQCLMCAKSAQSLHTHKSPGIYFFFRAPRLIECNQSSDVFNDTMGKRQEKHPLWKHDFIPMREIFLGPVPEQVHTRLF